MCVNYKITCACIHLKYTKHHRVHIKHPKKHIYYSPHSTVLRFPLYHRGQILSCAGDSERSRWSSTKPSASHGDPRWQLIVLLHIYKTHFFPIMLVSISMCVFSMILKYWTLYSKSKISLNREKLLKNDVNMSTILFIMEWRKWLLGYVIYCSL